MLAADPPSVRARVQSRQGKRYRELERTQSCTKHKPAKHTLTEGLVVAYCPHGIAVAIVFLNRHEGPVVCFDLLWRRFKEAPFMVVYDNACALHKVCLAREPVFFRATIFKIDRLHMAGHTACPRDGYGLDSLPADFTVISEEQLAAARARQAQVGGMRVPDDARPITIGGAGRTQAFNSQVAEQYNSQLRKIERSCHTMARPTFRKFVRNFCYRWNVKKMADMFGVDEHAMLAEVAALGTAPAEQQRRRQEEQRQRERRRQARQRWEQRQWRLEQETEGEREERERRREERRQRNEARQRRRDERRQRQQQPEQEPAEERRRRKQERQRRREEWQRRWEARAGQVAAPERPPRRLRTRERKLGLTDASPPRKRARRAEEPEQQKPPQLSDLAYLLCL